MGQELRLRVVAILAVVALVLFALAYWSVIMQTLNTANPPAGTNPPPTRISVNSVFSLFATTLAGIASALVAFAFGVPLPNNGQGLSSDPPPGSFWTAFLDRLRTIGHWLWGTTDGIKLVIGLLYVGVYFVIAILSGIAAATHDQIAPQMLIDFATIALGVGAASIVAVFARA